MKKLLILLLLIVASGTYASSDYDKDIIVLNQSRDDKVKIVFNEMMQYYEEEDENSFFNYVWEDRFLQDYITFEEAIEKDFRNYEIISFDSWIDKITTDGIKKYLYVRWEKRYETNDGSKQITKKGYSRFLFDEMNGQYKLIEVAGNHLWGDSLLEWRDEVPDIVGQEKEEIVVQTDDGNVQVVEQEEQDPGLPDLIISSAVCNSDTNITITVKNQGEADAVSPKYVEVSGIMSNGYPGTIAAGDEVQITSDTISVCWGNSYEVDPDNEIDEEDENNNSYMTDYPY